ncbi:MAG TPA: efflux RND transporter periplasmic adaptor subunit [Patescibacteria group bacterium]
MKNLFAKLKNPKILKPILIVIIILATISGYYFYQIKQGRVFIDDSLIEAPIIAVAPSAPGKLLSTNVYEGQNVKKGDPLANVGSQTLYADTNGLVIMSNNQIGSLVSATSPVVQLINPIDLRVAGTIDENKGLSDIKVGQVASFTVDALPGKTFWGYIDEISPSAKTTQVAFSISSERPTQQFVVYARFNASDYPQIKNGMSAKMTIYTKTN